MKAITVLPLRLYTAAHYILRGHRGAILCLFILSRARLARLQPRRDLYYLEKISDVTAEPEDCGEVAMGSPVKQEHCTSVCDRSANGEEREW